MGILTNSLRHGRQGSKTTRMRLASSSRMMMMTRAKIIAAVRKTDNLLLVRRIRHRKMDNKVARAPDGRGLRTPGRP
jgi:hypothetical protein